MMDGNVLLRKAPSEELRRKRREIARDLPLSRLAVTEGECVQIKQVLLSKTRGLLPASAFLHSRRKASVVQLFFGKCSTQFENRKS